MTDDFRDQVEAHLDVIEPKVDHIHDQVQQMAERIDQFWAENERLRVALREIRDFGHAPGCRATVVPIYECGCYGRSQATIARAALGEGG